ncbi:MAG: trypsin-like peptidase domain-containing protein [Spirochaetales bacterium]|nr:trypsin-like peptidase domain-containing protein [Spirochaetales bacterium]
MLFSQDLRQEIAIIKAEPVPSLKESYDRIAIWLENMRENNLSAEMKARKAGSHGSTFPVVIDGSETLFVTNYHVIAGAEKISLEWQPLEGEPLAINDCEVLYADPLRDLALVKLPRGSFSPGQGLEIISNRDALEDGMDIWAAGYPGLISSPTWQLSKGIVSNQKAIIPELVEEGLPYLIQHTSVIDPGSSGGPLMIRENETYRVVGVNSMSALYRHNTFFAIPSDVLSAFLREYGEGAGKASRQSLERNLDRFISLLSQDDGTLHDLALYVGDGLGCKNGWNLYGDRRSAMSSDERALWDKTFVKDTLLGMKEITALDLKDVFTGDDYTWQITSLGEGEAQVRVESASGKTYDTVWAFEKGWWALDVYPSDYAQSGTHDGKKAARKQSSDKDVISYVTALGIYAGPSYSLGRFDGEVPGFGGYFLGGEIYNMWNKYAGTSFSLGWESFKLTGKDSYDGTTYSVNRGCLEFGANINIFPAKLIQGRSVTPVIRGGVGFDTSLDSFMSLEGDSSPFSVYWLLGTGIQFEPENRDLGRLGVMVDYKSLSGLSLGMEDETGGDRLGLTLSYLVGY